MLRQRIVGNLKRMALVRSKGAGQQQFMTLGPANIKLGWLLHIHCGRLSPAAPGFLHALCSIYTLTHRVETP